MFDSFIRRALLAAVTALLPGVGAHVNAQVSRLAVSPKNLVNGDGRPKSVALSAELPPGGSIRISVDFRSGVGSSATQFIPTYEVRDNDERDTDRRGGALRTTLTRSFNDVGIYHVRVAESRTVLTVVHEPARSSWFSFIERLLGATGDGERSGDQADDSITARLDSRPVLSSIWVAPLPPTGREIRATDLAVKVTRAVTPAWSRDGALLACGAWRQDRWQIAAYVLGAAGVPTEKWRWPSTDSNGDFSPVWSPDGGNVAFVRRAPDSKTDIWLLYLDAQGSPTREARLTTLGTVRQLIAWDATMGLLFEVVGVAGGAQVREIWSMKVDASRQQPAGDTFPRPDPYRFFRGRVANRNSVIVDEHDTAPPLSTVVEKRAGNADVILLTGGMCTYRWPAVSRDGKWLALESDCPAPATPGKRQ